MWDWLVFLGGFCLLIPGANFLVNSASSLAGRLKIPNIVIGLTIVAFGTSSPEMIVNIIASVGGRSEIAMGNVIGSNIFNILLILGVTAIISPLVVKSSTTWIEIPFSLLTAAVVFILAYLLYAGPGVRTLSRTDGIILLVMFAGFSFYSYYLTRKGDITETVEIKTRSVLWSVILIVAGLMMLIAGGRIIVTSAVSIARGFGFTERIIGLTIVSAGTSLPELATSIVAALKGKTDIAIGNIVGSNIFNVCLILGLSTIISPIMVTQGAGIDLLVNVAASLLLFIFVFTRKGRQIDRMEGFLFVSAYLGYLLFLILS